VTDGERLQAAFAKRELISPCGGPGLVDLTRALARWAGANDVATNEHVAAIAGDLGDPRHLVFVFADGFGTCFVEHAPQLQRAMVRELRTIFPSSTAPALTTVATAEWPVTHGILGWWTHVEAIADTASVLPFHRRSDGTPLTELGVSIEQVVSGEPIGRRMSKPVLSLVPDRYLASGYSRWASGGTTRVGYGALEAAIDAAIAHLDGLATSSYTYLYWPVIDHAAHAHGCASAEVRAAVALLGREVERLARAIAPDGRVVVSADHGHLDMRQEGSDHFGPADPLAAHFRAPPSGDVRALCLHLERGHEEAFDAEFRARYGDRYVLLGIDEARAIGLLGPDPPSSVARRRMGDRLAISVGPSTLVWIDGAEASAVADQLVSAHSGLSPAEMMIPLIVL